MKFFRNLLNFLFFVSGQSGFYFGQPENRFVPAFQNTPQNAGPFFDQNGFNTQYRSTGPEFARQQIYNNQNDQSYSDARFGRQQASPFRTQTVRNQDSNQYYLNQADFVPNADSLQRPDPYGNRPTSFQFNNHPASTTRPEYSHFVQSSHNHDPSKQETFLGQITINNPFPDNPRDLQNFANTKIRQPNHSGFYKSSSLDNSDLQPGFPNAPEPVSQDIYDYTEKTKPTTYNPIKSDYASKVKQTRAQLNSRPSFYSAQKQEEPEVQKKPVTNDNYFNSNENNFSNSRSRFKPKPISTTTPHPQTERRNRFSPSTKAPLKVQAFNLRSNKVGFSPNKPHYTPTTEYKPLFDLEPLLEDEIPDTKLYGDTLRSHSNGSEDVQVIKSVEVSSEPPPTTEYDEDIESTIQPVEEEATTIVVNKLSTVRSNENKTRENEIKHTTETNTEPDETLHDPDVNEKKPLETTEYYDEEVEYVDENEPEHNKEAAHSHHEDSTFHNGEEIEYEEVPDNDEISTPVSEIFDVLTMKPKPTMVKDDNFKEFVDSALIDNTEPPTFVTEQFVEPNEKRTTIGASENLTDPPPILLGEEVVSVVTTKSVVNGTYKVPEITSRPQSTIQMDSDVSEITTEEALSDTKDSKPNQPPNATESWVVVASVQTSRSVSGARFLPFPAVAQEEKKQTLAEMDEKEEATLVKNKFDTSTTTEEYTETATTKPSLSTESIIDKLDDIQSRLSSGFLSGGFKAENQDFAVLTEMPHENVTKEEPTTPTTPIQIFTVKSTTSTSTTERTAPEPLPVTIKKFSPYSRPSPTTPKPKPKISSFDSIKKDDLTGLLPPGFKARPSFKDRKITTTTEKQETVTENKTAFTSAILKSKINIPGDISAFLPKGYKPPKDEKPFSIDDLLKNTKNDDISHFLPPGYKKSENTDITTTTTEKAAKNKQGLLANAEKLDISAFSPKGYKLLTTTTEKPSSKSDILAQAKPLDISAFLPPGFKLNETTTDKTKPILNNVKFADVSSLLPPGFKLDQKNKTEEKSNQTVETTTKAAANNFKIVFPSRPGAGKPGKRLTTPKPSNEGGSGGAGVSLPSIHKGWPSRFFFFLSTLYLSFPR